jgi:hypothetical protein
MVRWSLLRWLAALTVFSALLLYFTRFLRDRRAAAGFPFVFTYISSLLAGVVLPVLLVATLYLLVSGRRIACETSQQRILLFGTVAFFFGLVAEGTFILVSRLFW